MFFSMETETLNKSLGFFGYKYSYVCWSIDLHIYFHRRSGAGRNLRFDENLWMRSWVGNLKRFGEARSEGGVLLLLFVLTSSIKKIKPFIFQYSKF